MNASSLVLEMEACETYTAAWLWLSWFQPWFLGLLATAGLLGNLLVLLVFCLQRKPCSVADIYLGNLAAADLVLMCCLPFWALTISREYRWDFGELLCKLVNVAISMNYVCSIFFLALICLDRYMALVKPMSVSPFRRRSWAKRFCLVVWLLGFTFSLPILIFRTVSFVEDPGVLACILAYPHPKWRVHHNIASNIFCFLLPVLLMAYCTRHIVASLSDGGMLGPPSLRAEKKATYLVLAVLVVFLVCWGPHQLMRFLDTLDYFGLTPSCLWGHVLDIGIQLSTYLAYSNSAINPLLLVIVGRDFRKRAREVCGRKMRRRPKHSLYHTVSYSSVNRINDAHRISLDKQCGIYTVT
ncbi:B2 bradykinin receptor-like [Eucyclogobius newberryi]|uniref:B2 bradykinin receptor-like n=1 Tax=Eucyclogobius newberryi TaxID=166745 RepID=UPI003B5B19BB